MSSRAWHETVAASFASSLNRRATSQLGLEDQRAIPVTPVMFARALQAAAEPFLYWHYRGCIRSGFALHVVMRRGIARSTTK